MDRRQNEADSVLIGEDSEGKCRGSDAGLLTAAGELPVPFEARRTKAFEGAGHVEALGVGAAGGGQSALVDVGARRQRVAREARGTHTLVGTLGVDAGGRVAAGERPVGGRARPRREERRHLHLVLGRVDALVNILLVRRRKISGGEAAKSSAARGHTSQQALVMNLTLCVAS